MNAMSEYKISVGISDVGAIKEYIASAALPSLSAAVDVVAQATRADWMKAVSDARLWVGEKVPYVASIQYRMTGPLTALVWSDYKYAEEIENGRPAKDLKKMLDTSLKVRRTQSGKRFLVIPMRHNTPGAEATGQAMPSAIYGMIKDAEPSRITGVGMRPSGQTVTLSPRSGMAAVAGPKYLSNPKTGSDMMVRSRNYQWGDRLTRGTLAAAGLSQAEVKRYAGMVRMDNKGFGVGRHSAYLTFRIMMEGKPGWIVPAKPGLNLASGVAAAMTPKAAKIFGEAVKRDLA